MTSDPAAPLPDLAFLAFAAPCAVCRQEACESVDRYKFALSGRRRNFRSPIQTITFFNYGKRNYAIRNYFMTQRLSAGAERSEVIPPRLVLPFVFVLRLQGKLMQRHLQVFQKEIG